MDEQILSYSAESRLYHIGDVAAFTGITADCLRAWERVGLLSPRRSPGGVRQYTENDIARIRLIARTLQQQKLTRHAVTQLLLSGDLAPDAADYAPGLTRPRPTRKGRGGNSARAGHGGASSAEHLLGAVAHVNEALASGRAMEEILTVICYETCRTFGVAATILRLIVPPTTSSDPSAPQHTSSPGLVRVATFGLDPANDADASMQTGISLDDILSPAVRAIQQRRGVIINTVADPLPAHRKLYMPGVAFLVMPLFAAGGAPLGVITLCEALDPERFDEVDLEDVRLFAIQAAIAIESARLHARVKAAQEEAESERARWKAAIDDLPGLVFTCDTQSRITYVSPGCSQLLGWSDDMPEAPATRNQAKRPSRRHTAVPPAPVHPRPLHRLPIAQALREHRVLYGTNVLHQRPDGTGRHIVWDIAPIAKAHGEVTGIVAVGRDMTIEWRQREREVCLAAVTRAAAGAPDDRGVTSRAARVLTALAETSSAPMMAATLYVLDDQADVLRRVGTFSGVRSTTHGPAVPLSKFHPWWNVLIAGPVYSTLDGARPHWLRDIGLRLWETNSTRAWATVPLRVGGQFRGALSVGLSVPFVWDAAERAWLESCADAVAVGIEIDRLFATEQQHVKALEVALAMTTGMPRDPATDKDEHAS